MLNRLESHKAFNLNQPRINSSKALNLRFLATNKADTFQSIAFLGASTPLDKTPINTLFNKFKPCTLEECQKTFAGDQAFLDVAKEINELGYSKLSFINLRATLIKEDGSYNMKKLTTLIDLASSNSDRNKPIRTVREQYKDASWINNRSMVEYLNVRALGINNSDGEVKRLGNVLDGIVYTLQSRCGGFHIAPFHQSAFFNHAYVPKDTYSVDQNILSDQLTKNGFNYRNQIKLLADVCHAKRDPIALFYDTLPHTGDLSVNYLDMPEAARWIDLDEKVIEKNSKIFDQLRSCYEDVSINTYEEFSNILENQITKALKVDTNSIYADLHKSLDHLYKPETRTEHFKDETTIELLYSIKNVNNDADFSIIYKNPKIYIEGKEKEIESELYRLTLRKAIVLSTHLAENDADIKTLRRNSEKIWASSNKNGVIPSSEASDIVLSKDSKEISKKVRSIVKKQLGKENPTYEDIQKSEENWDSSIKKHIMSTEHIFNMPVGAWNGLEPELVGFHKEHNYPIFACRANNQEESLPLHKPTIKYTDVSDRIVGTMARRRLNLSNGNENKAAITEWKDAVEFWMQTGFDGIRIDQTNNMFVKPYDYNSNSGQTLEEYFKDQDYAYDTMLLKNTKSLVDELKKDIGSSLPVIAENMMNYPIEQVQKTLKEVKDMGALTTIGRFHFASSFQELLNNICAYKSSKQAEGNKESLLNTIECHDNQLTGRDLGGDHLKNIGTGPASKAMDGLTNLRIRFLLNSSGLPYITTQALTGIGSEEMKNQEIHSSVLLPINHSFSKEAPKYKVGDSEYSFNDFKHNYFNFVKRPEIKAILKGGQITNISPSEKVIAFTVNNKGKESLLIIANSGDHNENNVHLTAQSGFNNLTEATEYFVDSSQGPKKVSLAFNHENKINFDELKAGEIRIFKFDK